MKVQDIMTKIDSIKSPLTDIGRLRDFIFFQMNVKLRTGLEVSER